MPLMGRARWHCLFLSGPGGQNRPRTIVGVGLLTPELHPAQRPVQTQVWLCVQGFISGLQVPEIIVWNGA